MLCVSRPISREIKFKIKIKIFCSSLQLFDFTCKYVVVYTPK